MLQSVHLISNSIPGVGHTDGGCLPCSGVSGSAICMLQHSSYRHYNQYRKFKSLSLQNTSRDKATICDATSSNNRRNQHFSRQNKHGFSRSRNRQTEEGDGSEKVEESEMFSSKDGPLLTSSGSSKFQATATPGPREREIVQLFRKVQAQLRERAAAKEERKIDESQKKSKPTETVDSLLKLLRKHSGQEGKKSIRSDISNRDFILDQSEQNGSVPAERNTNTFGSSSRMKQEKQEIEAPVTTRPRSNFQRRSPVPQVLPVYSDDKEHINSGSHTDFGSKVDPMTLEPELEVEPEAESDFEAAFSDDDVFDDLSDADDEIPEIHEDDSDSNLPQQAVVIHSDLSGMKLTELRALAKSRGLKGFSKLKKHDLIELLSESAT